VDGSVARGVTSPSSTESRGVQAVRCSWLMSCFIRFLLYRLNGTSIKYAKHSAWEGTRTVWPGG
jgi:hypothetical protein